MDNSASEKNKIRNSKNRLHNSGHRFTRNPTEILWVSSIFIVYWSAVSQSALLTQPLDYLIYSITEIERPIKLYWILLRPPSKFGWCCGFVPVNQVSPIRNLKTRLGDNLAVQPGDTSSLKCFENYKSMCVVLLNLSMNKISTFRISLNTVISFWPKLIQLRRSNQPSSLSTKDHREVKSGHLEQINQKIVVCIPTTMLTMVM